MAAFSDDHFLVLVDHVLHKNDSFVAFVLDALLLCIVDPLDLSLLAIFCAGGLWRHDHAIDILHVAVPINDSLMVDVAYE